MAVYYLATPYTKYPGGHEAAFQEAARIHAALAGRGLDIFCPIVHTHPLVPYVPRELQTLDFWLRLDRWAMDHCDVLIVAMMDGWRDSAGVAREIEHFKQAGKTVVYMDPQFFNYSWGIRFWDGPIGGKSDDVIADPPLEQAMMPTREEVEKFWTNLGTDGAASMPAVNKDSTNPKDALASRKVALGLLPAAGKIHGALAMANGATKYGPYNWREKQVRATVYLDAIERHLLAYRDGEDLSDAGINHLGHIIAGASILLDAIETGNAIDDRPADGVAAALLDEFTEAA